LDKLISGTDFSDDSQKNPLLSKKPKVGIQAITGSSLYQIPIPEDLETKTYGSLFKHLCKDDIVPLGILRGVFANMSMGAKSNKSPYVFTNPPKDTELFMCDRVFVLSQKVLTATKSSTREILEAFMHAHSGPTQGRRRGTNDDVGFDGLKDEFNDITNAQRSLERALTSMSVDMSKKFEAVLEAVENAKGGPGSGGSVAHSVIQRQNSTNSMNRLTTFGIMKSNQESRDKY
jgi:hypothetical protein